MGYTTNYNLYVVDTATGKFEDWRKNMSGTKSTSNMNKIDTALAGLQTSINNINTTLTSMRSSIDTATQNNTAVSSDLDEVEAVVATKAAASVSRSGTLTTSSWSGTAAPYTQTAAITGITASTNGIVQLAQSATAAQREAAREAILSISAQGTNSITIVADGEKPTVDLPIVVICIG